MRRLCGVAVLCAVGAVGFARERAHARATPPLTQFHVVTAARKLLARHPANVTLRAHTAHVAAVPSPLPLHAAARAGKRRRAEAAPDVKLPWADGQTAFDWRDLATLPAPVQQAHNRCFAETAAVTLAVLWQRLTDTVAEFDPETLLRCAHDAPGAKGLPTDILRLQDTFDAAGECHPAGDGDGIQMAPRPLVLCDLAGDTHIENRLEDEMLPYAPVNVAIESTNPVFRAYGGGVLLPEHVETRRGVVDHAVSLVGFGADETTGQEYWTLRNSWGEGWGEDGFFRVQRRRDGTGVLGSYAAVTTAHTVGDVHAPGATV